MLVHLLTNLSRVPFAKEGSIRIELFPEVAVILSLLQDHAFRKHGESRMQEMESEQSAEELEEGGLKI